MYDRLKSEQLIATIGAYKIAPNFEYLTALAEQLKAAESHIDTVNQERRDAFLKAENLQIEVDRLRRELRNEEDAHRRAREGAEPKKKKSPAQPSA
jgi:regulator of replication initiation timing